MAEPPPAQRSGRRRLPNPAAVNPALLAGELQAAGWRVAGQRAGVYVRLNWPGESALRGRRSLLIPLDPPAGDFAPEMNGVLRELADAADVGRRAETVLDVLAGAHQVDPQEPDPLDYAMWTVWMQSGRWEWTTRKMTTEAREATVAAVLRYDQWLKRDEPDDTLLTRERLAWWD